MLNPQEYNLTPDVWEAVFMKVKRYLLTDC